MDLGTTFHPVGMRRGRRRYEKSWVSLDSAVSCNHREINGRLTMSYCFSSILFLLSLSRSLFNPPPTHTFSLSHFSSSNAVHFCARFFFYLGQNSNQQRILLPSVVTFVVFKNIQQCSANIDLRDTAILCVCVCVCVFCSTAHF